MLTFLGIFLYILAVMIFSEYAPAGSTNWSIFYFSSVFSSFIMIGLNEIIKSFDKYTRLLLFVCVLFFFIMLIQQVSLINCPYDFYMESVNDKFIDTIRFSFIIIALFLISFKYILKCRKHSAKS